MADAETDYVLPYPSFMPGSKLYKLHLIWDALERYWHFGSFGQFKYNLKQSDKYLVEAKTLFEYKQYLLAYNALKKSDKYFIDTRVALDQAESQNKDITQKQNLLKNAALKHIDWLDSIKRIIPDKFTWRPEKESETDLGLKGAVEEAIKIRRI